MSVCYSKSYIQDLVLGLIREQVNKKGYTLTKSKESTKYGDDMNVLSKETKVNLEKGDSFHTVITLLEETNTITVKVETLAVDDLKETVKVFYRDGKNSNRYTLESPGDKGKNDAHDDLEALLKNGVPHTQRDGWSWIWF